MSNIEFIDGEPIRGYHTRKFYDPEHQKWFSVIVDPNGYYRVACHSDTEEDCDKNISLMQKDIEDVIGANT